MMKGKKQQESKQPTNMEELLASSGYKVSLPKKGETIKGLITAKSKKMVLVDIGAKTEGVVTGREFEQVKDLIADLKVGDEVDVYVLSDDTEEGQVMLSLRRAMMDKLWQMIDDYRQNQKEVEVLGVEQNKGGMIVRWQGLRGFVPTSQFGAKRVGELDKLVGVKFGAVPIEVDPEKNRLIFSEKLVSEAEEVEKKAEAVKSVKVGEVYEGVVTGVMSFGAFVSVEVPLQKSKGEIGKVEGLVHISEISWEKVENVNKYVKVGERIKVKVIGIEEGTGKLNLSLKRLTPDPWENIEKKYGEGRKVKGTVVRKAPFGVFVHFEPGVDGLIHVSRLPADKELKIGEEIEVFIESLDKEHRRMSLAMVLKEVPVGYK